MLLKRMLSQGLTGSRFKEPVELVEWMGALQAQDIRSVRWAVGMRTDCPSLTAVREAMDSGKIIRIHVMRPTWHYIPAKDIKWMSALSAKSFMAACTSYARQSDVSGDDYRTHRRKFEKLLEGRHLTRQEIGDQLGGNGNDYHDRMVSLCLSFAEAEGLICSGVPKGDKHTYALVDERVSCPVELSWEEALSELARRYFRSHGPAALEDFIWWSGLGVRVAKAGIESLGTEMIREHHGDRTMFTHISSTGLAGEEYSGTSDNFVRFLPPFDEYLISYKNRFDCIKENHCRLAYNNFGIFQPVILHKGRITGNWKWNSKKTAVTTTFFPGCRKPAEKLLRQAEKELLAFYAG